MSMNPPDEIYLKAEVVHQTYCTRQVTQRVPSS
jgi:hypothetical protein